MRVGATNTSNLKKKLSNHRLINKQSMWISRSASLTEFHQSIQTVTAMTTLIRAIMPSWPFLLRIRFKSKLRRAGSWRSARLKHWRKLNYHLVGVWQTNHLLDHQRRCEGLIRHRCRMVKIQGSQKYHQTSNQEPPTTVVLICIKFRK